MIPSFGIDTHSLRGDGLLQHFNILMHLVPKGDIAYFKNDRPISFLYYFYQLFLKIIAHKVNNRLDLHCELVRFRRCFGAKDPLQNNNTIIEKCL